MKPMRMKEIAQIIAFQHKTTLNKIRGNSRVGPIVLARHRAMKAMFEIGYSFHDIARFFDRDHTTVMYACRKADPEFDVTYWQECENEN